MTSTHFPFERGTNHSVACNRHGMRFDSKIGSAAERSTKSPSAGKSPVVMRMSRTSRSQSVDVFTIAKSNRSESAVPLRIRPHSGRSRHPCGIPGNRHSATLVVSTSSRGSAKRRSQGARGLLLNSVISSFLRRITARHSGGSGCLQIFLRRTASPGQANLPIVAPLRGRPHLTAISGFFLSAIPAANQSLC